MCELHSLSCCTNYADRVKTRCLAATSVLQVTEDHERHRVTPRIAPMITSVFPRRRPDPSSQCDQIGHRWSGFSARRGLHRRHQFVKGDEVEHPPDIVGKCGQAELTPNLLQSAHQERALVHPLFDRAKWMLHRLTSLIENLGPLTVYLLNGGLLEYAQQMEAHESARTTKLYDRRNDQVTLDQVERIVP